MVEFTAFRRRTLAAVKANLEKAEALVESHGKMLESRMLSAGERKTVETGLEQNIQTVKMYKDTIKNLEKSAR